MTTSYFGTDGIRGRAGDGLPPELALRAAAAFVASIPPAKPGKARSVVLGGDPRLSTPMLRAAVASGLALGGSNVVDIGTVPTPLVPFELLRRKAQGGVMVTASHNPVPDNGLKFFDGDGLKLDSAAEMAISRQVDMPGWRREAQRVEFGQVQQANASDYYLQRVSHDFGAPVAGNLPIVLDCAYGAAAELAPQAFLSCGYSVTALHSSFDGQRVNVQCGTTNLAALGRAVRRQQAALGIAFDGDGDRMLAVDHLGRPVSGDRIIALFALKLSRYRRQRSVVMTHMTNLGVELALARYGISMLRTEVGDTKVLAAMRSSGLNLGGEQSGHIIMRDRLPTGDGLVAGLQLASLIARAGRPLAELVAEFTEYPQQLTNLVVRDRLAWEHDKRLNADLEQIRLVYPQVRFYLRASGTENLLRVLTEAQAETECLAANATACDAIRAWDKR